MTHKMPHLRPLNTRRGRFTFCQHKNVNFENGDFLRAGVSASRMSDSKGWDGFTTCLKPRVTAIAEFVGRSWPFGCCASCPFPLSMAWGSWSLSRNRKLGSTAHRLTAVDIFPLDRSAARHFHLEPQCFDVWPVCLPEINTRFVTDMISPKKGFRDEGGFILPKLINFEAFFKWFTLFFHFLILHWRSGCNNYFNIQNHF